MRSDWFVGWTWFSPADEARVEQPLIGVLEQRERVVYSDVKADLVLRAPPVPTVPVLVEVEQRRLYQKE